MALRNQPYLPLYVQDFLSDEKLAYCSASSTGVYIRIMCLMHKSETYGKILLKQKFKQSDKQIKNFASQLAVQMPYDFNTILCALEELVDSKVLSEEPCALIQKRMVRDDEISEARALSGKKGGKNSLGKKAKETTNFASDFAQAKTQANTEYEYVIEIEDEIIKEGGMGETKPKKFVPPVLDEVAAYCRERKNAVTPGMFIDHYTSNGWMVGKTKMKDWKASVRTWERNNFETKKNETNNRISVPENIVYEGDSI
jgi:uncharacterized protein YdaU (DUF1376 family)